MKFDVGDYARIIDEFYIWSWRGRKVRIISENGTWLYNVEDINTSRIANVFTDELIPLTLPDIDFEWDVK